MTVSRRAFLHGSAVATGAVAIGASASASASAGSGPAAPASRAIAFHGEHQAGISTERQAHAAFVVVRPDGR